MLTVCLWVKHMHACTGAVIYTHLPDKLVKMFQFTASKVLIQLLCFSN